MLRGAAACGTAAENEPEPHSRGECAGADLCAEPALSNPDVNELSGDFLLLSFGPPLLDDCGLQMVMPT
jgi:hypothetical protein